MRGFSLASVLAAAALLATIASPAGASVALGQLAQTPVQGCNSSAQDHLQPTVTFGDTYVVPGAGRITSWSHNAFDDAQQTLTMKIFRKVADPATYTVIGHDGPRPLAGGTVNTFPASIEVNPGDVLGLNQESTLGHPTACFIFVSGESHLAGPTLGPESNLPDGQSGVFTPFGVPSRLNLTAVFEPSNTFTLGATMRNKKKGTATLTVNVPNPGELTGSGKGVKAAAAGATTSKAVTPGAAQLLIKAAKGKKKRKLNETGTVKLNVAVTYTPSGGDPSTQSVKVKLKKKL